MTSNPPESIADSLSERFKEVTGVYDFRIIPAWPLDELHNHRWRKWLEDGHNAGMTYMERYGDLRSDPALLLEGAQSMIVCAFNYTPARRRDRKLPQIATFAYGDDYHDVIRKRLTKGVELLSEITGGEWRICVDSAPLFERAYAERSGLGTRCDNGLIAIPGAGTRVLLAEIISTVSFDRLHSLLHEDGISKSTPTDLCLHCGACVRKCPTGALQADSTVDAGRCLSYLTIEHKGDFPERINEDIKGDNISMPLFGCDICQDVCPLNNPLIYPIQPTEIHEFTPSDTIMNIDAAEALALEQPEFSRLFRNSPIKRTKLAGLHRNATAALEYFLGNLNLRENEQR